jgi:hypothetical protein
MFSHILKSNQHPTKIFSDEPMTGHMSHAQEPTLHSSQTAQVPSFGLTEM